ncbi:unnamed protein product, partial [Symbiodinium sp. CCMP2456]
EEGQHSALPWPKWLSLEDHKRLVVTFRGRSSAALCIVDSGVAEVSGSRTRTSTAIQPAAGPTGILAAYTDLEHLPPLLLFTGRCGGPALA